MKLKIYFPNLLLSMESKIEREIKNDVITEKSHEKTRIRKSQNLTVCWFLKSFSFYSYCFGLFLDQQKKQWSKYGIQKE